MRDTVTRARLGMNLQYCAEAGWYWIFDDVTLGIVTTGLEPSLSHYNISFIGLLWADISYSSSDLPPYSMILEEEWAQLSSLARETMNQNSSSSTFIDCWRQSTDGSCWNWSEDTPGDKTQWLARGNFMRLNYIVISGSTIRNRTVHSLLTSRQRFHCHEVYQPLSNNSLTCFRWNICYEQDQSQSSRRQSYFHRIFLKLNLS